MNIHEFFTLEQCASVTVDKNVMPYMKSLHSCLNRMKGDGYTDNFEKTFNGIRAQDSDRDYLLKDYSVINSFTFEGNPKSEDDVIVDMIETADGRKGTLVKSYESPTSGVAYRL